MGIIKREYGHAFDPTPRSQHWHSGGPAIFYIGHRARGGWWRRSLKASPSPWHACALEDTLFDALIREAAERFPLDDKARPFVGLLAGVIFNGSGGFAGLRERFSRQGMEALFDGWVGGHAGDNVLQPGQFASVVGDEPVSRLGIPKSAVTVAGATVLPKLISLLTGHGHLPAQMPAEAAALLVPPARAAAQPDVHLAPARTGAQWRLAEVAHPAGADPSGPGPAAYLPQRTGTGSMKSPS